MESVTGLRFLRAKLVDDATLMALITGVFDEQAPAGTALPYAILALQDGADEIGLGGTYLLSGLTYEAQIVGAGASYAGIEAAADRLRTVLHQATGTVGASGAVYECLQVAPLQYRENGADGQTYSHLGGLYELVVRG